MDERADGGGETGRVVESNLGAACSEFLVRSAVSGTAGVKQFESSSGTGGDSDELSNRLDDEPSLSTLSFLAT